MLKKKKNSILVFLMALIMLLTFEGCSSKEKKVLSASKLEQVLYDYHFAEAMAADSEVDSIKAQQYLDAVFKKHGITQDEFDTTMVYYLRHADLLNDIYAHLSDRISNELRLQGLDETQSVSSDLKADTANIWNKEKSRIFLLYAPYNLMKFSFKTDSTYKAGDRFILKFKSNFFYQDGSRNGYAAMSVKLKNDSVITRSVSMTSSMEYTLDITDTKEEGIKEVRGFIMQRNGYYDDTNKRPSTLRLMFVDNISLVRMHAKKNENEDDNENENNNSNENDNNEKTDSIKLVSADSVSTPKPGMHKFHSR